MANALLLHSAIIYNVTGKTATHTGDVYEIVPVKGTDVDLSEAVWDGFATVTTTGGASSPTADLTIETSPDNVTWLAWDGIAQITTAITVTESMRDSAKNLYRYVRVKLTLGGGTAPTTAAKVSLCSTTKFTVTAV